MFVKEESFALDLILGPVCIRRSTRWRFIWRTWLLTSWWFVWMARNDAHFRQIPVNIQNLVHKILVDVYAILRMHLSDLPLPPADATSLLPQSGQAAPA